MIRTIHTLALVSVVLLMCLSSSSAKTFAQTEYTGKLHTELIPDVGSFSVRQLSAATQQQLAALKITPPSGQQAFTGKIRALNQEMLVVLLSSATAATFCADVDQDGTLPTSECFAFSEVKDLSGPNVYFGEVTLNLPALFQYFKSVPLVVRLFKDQMAQLNTRTVLYTYSVYVNGVADVSGTKTLVKYSLDLKTGLINPLNGRLGFDMNGDGKIDMTNFSPEWTAAEQETVIFRVGQHYVSTKSVNTETGEIGLRSHDPKEYQRIEVNVGTEIPDFTFQDFNGQARKLSDFKGKYVLLDFWGSWCTPCKVEMPFLKAAYARFKSRGFEILGMDKDEDPAKAKLFVSENQMLWTQATTESIRDLIRFRFRVSGWPSKILIDPQQRVVMVDARGQLNSDKLADVLDQLLPKNSN